MPERMLLTIYYLLLTTYYLLLTTYYLLLTTYYLLLTSHAREDAGPNERGRGHLLRVGLRLGPRLGLGLG